jgi:bla regulator protein BlaR1
MVGIITLASALMICSTASAFEKDPEVVGRWKTVDFVKTIDQFEPSAKHWKGDLFLFELDFHKRGYVTCSNKKVDEYQQDWTKGKVDPGSEHPAHYSIKEIKGETYLFFQWISGDVTKRGKTPSYYVLKKK